MSEWVKAKAFDATSFIKGLWPATRSGILGVVTPLALLKIARAWLRWDFTPGGLVSIAAARNPERLALIDDGGTLTYAELEERSLALARALRHGNIRPRDRIAIMSRNHRGIFLVVSASGRLGTDMVMLNTGSAADQIAAVIAEQKPNFLFIDEEFTHLLPEDFHACPVAVSWLEDVADTSSIRPGWTSLREILATAPPATLRSARLPFRPRRGRTIVLTSGTTGTPKGARRPEPRSWMPAASVMSRIPYRSGKSVYLMAPIFHSWGFANIQFVLALRSTAILRRHFSAEDALTTIERYHPHTLALVPTMLQRMLEIVPSTHSRDLSSVRVIASCGSAIPEHVVELSLEVFGPTLYNQYGSTEVSWAAIANPKQLSECPTTVGKAPLGTRISILDENDLEVPQGEIGRIFVGNNMLFEGYTRPGADKTMVNGKISTGDLGYFDQHGWLYISGREDDMIVSGGENVYPRETEDVLSGLPGLREVSVIGVDDERFGQALAAYVVRTDTKEGHELTESHIRDHVKKHLARHSVPRVVIFMDKLPRNAIGKVIPRELPPVEQQKEVETVAS